MEGGGCEGDVVRSGRVGFWVFEGFGAWYEREDCLSALLTRVCV